MNQVKKVMEEERDLSKKCDRLSIFLNTGGYEELPKRQRILLAQQLSSMQSYLKILSERIWYMKGA